MIMSEKKWSVVDWIKLASASVAIVISISAGVGGYFVLQYRVNADERTVSELTKKVDEIGKANSESHDLLISINSLTQQMDKRLIRIENKLDK